MYIHIYIRTQVRFVIASSRRRQLGGQLCAPLQGSEEYLIPSLVFLISPPVPLSPLSHLIRRLRRLLKWRSSSSPLSSSLASISGGRERAPRLFFRFQKPRRSPRPIRSSNSNSTTNYCLSLDRIHIYTLVSLLSFARGRSRGWTWNPWREWNPREYPSGHACRRAGAVLPSIVDEPADRSRRVD